MREIIVYHKSGNRVALVDDEDFDDINRYKWYLTKPRPDILYARARYVDPFSRRKLCSMHRLILKIKEKSIFVDHIDHNGLNNQKNNIRRATRSQNGQNKRASKNNKTGFRGVSKHSNSSNFRVCIYHDGRPVNGGSFKTPIEAARRWNELAIQYHGEFAYQNPV